MKWKSAYATGIQETELQHKTLLQFLTDFEEAIGRKVHWNTVQPLVARAKEFVKIHFAVEQALMQAMMATSRAERERPCI